MDSSARFNRVKSICPNLQDIDVEEYVEYIGDAMDSMTEAELNSETEDYFSK